jgi:hypothetical protein
MYEKPRVERLGSLRELTRQTKWPGFNDGTVYGPSGDNIGYRS